MSESASRLDGRDSEKSDEAASWTWNLQSLFLLLIVAFTTVELVLAVQERGVAHAALRDSREAVSKANQSANTVSLSQKRCVAQCS